MAVVCAWLAGLSVIHGFRKVVAPSERQAVGKSPAVGEVDLLTVVMHEMGHLFGLPEVSETDFPHDVMAETLGLSTRRFPLPGPPDVPESEPLASPAEIAASDIFRQWEDALGMPEDVLIAQVADSHWRIMSLNN